MGQEDKYSLKYYAEFASVHGIYEMANSPYRIIRVIWGICLLVAMLFCGREIQNAIQGYAENPSLYQVQTSQLDEVPSLTVCTKSGAENEVEMGPWRASQTGNCSEPWITSDKLYMRKFFRMAHNARFDTSGRKPDLFIKSLEKKYWSGFCSEPRSPGESSDHTLDLKNFYARYHPTVNLTECYVGIYRKYRAYDFEKKFLTKSWYSATIVESVTYLAPDVHYVHTKNITKKFIDDTGGGFCSTYEFKNQELHRRGLLRLRPRQSHAKYYGFFINGARLMQKYLHISGWEKRRYDINVQVTKFTKIKNCEVRKVGEDPDYVRRKCLSHEIYHNVGCCLCGHVGQECPANAPCCFSKHFCEAMRNSSFRDAWIGCSPKKPRCEDTAYTATIAYSEYTKPEPRIFIDIKNSHAILTVIEVSRFTPEQFLGTIGGILGLFIGGSLLSIVELFLFFVGFCLSKCWTCTNRIIAIRPTNLKV